MLSPSGSYTQIEPEPYLRFPLIQDILTGNQVSCYLVQNQEGIFRVIKTFTNNQLPSLKELTENTFPITPQLLNKTLSKN
jgi:hypothetical protein